MVAGEALEAEAEEAEDEVGFENETKKKTKKNQTKKSHFFWRLVFFFSVDIQSFLSCLLSLFLARAPDVQAPGLEASPRR